MKKVDWETESKNLTVWQKQIENFYYGLKRPKSYNLSKCNSTYVNPELPEENETEDDETYRARISELMKGIDCYMAPDEALSLGLATGMFTNWEDEETNPLSPAFVPVDFVQTPPRVNEPPVAAPALSAQDQQDLAYVRQLREAGVL